LIPNFHVILRFCRFGQTAPANREPHSAERAVGDLALSGWFQFSDRVGTGGMVPTMARPVDYRKAMGSLANLGRWRRWAIGGSVTPTSVLRTEGDFVRVQQTVLPGGPFQALEASKYRFRTAAEL
jgi:hypothetical protein